MANDLIIKRLEATAQGGEEGQRRPADGRKQGTHFAPRKLRVRRGARRVRSS